MSRHIIPVHNLNKRYVSLETTTNSDPVIICVMKGTVRKSNVGTVRPRLRSSL